MPSFGKTSKARLSTCSPVLQQILNEAIKFVDFSVIEGTRGKNTQDRYLELGVTTLAWPDSKHNAMPSEAVDVWPYVKGLGSLSGHPDQIKEIAEKTGRSEREAKEFVYKSFAHLAGILQAIAQMMGYRLRWGGDWDGDGNLLDQNFHDLPHLEVAE